jgi:hypothetical protein
MQRPEGEIEKGLLGYEGREGVIRTILTKFRVQDEVNKDTTNRMKYKRSMFWIRNYFKDQISIGIWIRLGFKRAFKCPT